MRAHLVMWLAVLCIGCVAENTVPREGVQVGEEEVAADDPCDRSETEVGPDDAVLDGWSARELLDALPLDVTASPSWYDGADEALDMVTAWDGGPVYLNEVTGDDPDCDRAANLQVGITLALVSASGRVDDIITETVGLVPGLDVRVAYQGPAGGSLDLDGVLAEVADLGTPSTSVLDVWVGLGPDGFVQGVATAIGWPGTATEPENVVEVVERTLATW